MKDSGDFMDEGCDRKDFPTNDEIVIAWRDGCPVADSDLRKLLGM